MYSSLLLIGLISVDETKYVFKHFCGNGYKTCVEKGLATISTKIEYDSYYCSNEEQYVKYVSYFVDFFHDMSVLSVNLFFKFLDKGIFQVYSLCAEFALVLL